MPFTRPTRSELLDSARTELETRLPGADARLRRSVLDVLARMIAQVAHTLFGYLAFLVQQAFPTTAVDEFLRQWASLYGVNEIPANFAQGLVVFTGSDLATIPQETLVRRADGREYRTLAEGVISAGTATVSVLSVLPGLDANTDAGVSVTTLSQLPGVLSTATVDTGGITGGTDVEDVESLRSRLVARIQRPPAGGTEADYVARAKEYAGVTDVFVFAPLVNPSVAASIGSVTEGADVQGVYSAKGLSVTAKLIVAFQTNADMANSETVTLSAKIGDATSSVGAGAASFATVVAAVVIATAPGSGGPHTVVGQYVVEVSIAAARAFLNARDVRLTTSGAGTFKAWTASIEYQGGPGEVGIAPLFYDRANPLPLAADLVAVQGLMDAPEFLPMTATPIVYALTADPKAFTIHLVTDTAAIRASIQADLADLYRREAEPGGKILISHIREVISQAAGETDHTLTTPTVDHDLAGDRTKIHTVGAFTWT